MPSTQPEPIARPHLRGRARRMLLTADRRFATKLRPTSGGGASSVSLEDIVGRHRPAGDLFFLTAFRHLTRPNPNCSSPVPSTHVSRPGSGAGRLPGDLEAERGSGPSEDPRVLPALAQVRLLKGEAREILDSFPPATFDGCISDPYYGIGIRPDDMLPDEGMLAAILRVLKPGARMALFGDDRTWDVVGAVVRRAGFIIEGHCIWLYATGRPRKGGMPRDGFTPIVVGRAPGVPLVKSIDSAARISWRDEWDREQARRANTLHGRSRRTPAPRADAAQSYEPNEGGRYPTNVFADDELGGRLVHIFTYPKVRDSKGHPFAKPVDLMAHLVRLFIPPNGHLVDPFAGGGSTGVGASWTGRRATLIDRDPAALGIMEKRFNAPGHNLGRRLGAFRSLSVPQRPADINMSRHEHLHHSPNERPSPGDDLKTAQEMAALLNRPVSRLTLIRWARKGRLPAIKVGRLWMFEPTPVIAALRARTREKTPDVDSGNRAGTVRRPDLQGGSAQGSEPAPLQTSQREGRRREAGTDLSIGGGRVDFPTRDHQVRPKQGHGDRLTLRDDQRAELQRLLDRDLPAVGEDPSGSRDP